MTSHKPFTVKFEQVGIRDVNEVGGKNASLGEMIGALKSKSVPVPSGFIVTATAYFHFLEKTGLKGPGHEKSRRASSARRGNPRCYCKNRVSRGSYRRDRAWVSRA